MDNKLKTTFIQFEEIGSTNTWAKENVGCFDVNELVIVSANQQTHGRGQFDRIWQSPPHVNLYISFIFYLDKNRLDLGHISQLMAVTLIQVLNDYNLETKIKWPNDLMINKKKIAGILTETVELKQCRAIVCGLGLNVNMDSSQLLLVGKPATSLAIECSSQVDVELVKEKLILCFKRNLEDYLEVGFRPFVDLFKSNLLFQENEFVRIVQGKNEMTGRFKSYNADGSLTLLLENGKRMSCYSGEIDEIR